MKLEIRVPISPTRLFFRRIMYLARSVRACGGDTARARIVVSVGDDVEPYDVASVQEWTDDKIVWRWADRGEFQRFSYHATAMDRFLVESDADIILLADADVVFAKNIDDVLNSLLATPAVAGLIAHIPPFLALSVEGSWPAIFQRVGLPFPRDLYQHSGYRVMYDDPRHRYSPAYFNMGAVLVPAAMLREIARVFPRWLRAAQTLNLSRYVSQLALSFAIYDLDLPRIILEPRYNFPNDPQFDSGYPNDLADVRILHYLRPCIIDRERDLSTSETVRSLIGRKDLKGSNELFRALIECFSAQ